MIPCSDSTKFRTGSRAQKSPGQLSRPFKRIQAITNEISSDMHRPVPYLNLSAGSFTDVFGSFHRRAPQALPSA